MSILYLFLLIALLLSACLGNSFSHPKYKESPGGVLANRRYIVELTQAPDVTVNSFIDFTNTHSDNIHIRRTISHEFINAVSIAIKENNVEKEHATLKLILDHMHVESISPVKIYTSNKVVSAPKKAANNLSAQQVELMSPHRLSQVERVHKELKLRGEGVFIGVIDTGIDYNHPALGGGFGPGFKVQAGYDLVGDNYNASDPLHSIQESPYPLDNCSVASGATGHGTHVSGIIAGYDPINNFSGVAPGANLGHWRVGGCNDQISSDALLKALTMAYDAGVHIISVSIGADIPWSSTDYIASKIIKKISDHGVSVVIAAGNNGNYGILTVSYPSVSIPAFSVGSVGNEYNHFDCYISATGVSHPIPCNLSRNSTSHIIGTSKPLVNSNVILPNKKTMHACDFVSKDVKGKIVITLYDSSLCESEVQMENIYKAGAIGVIFYGENYNSHLLKMISFNSDLQISSISYDNALEILKALKTNSNISIKYTNDLPTYLFKNEKYKYTSTYFSSIGPTSELNFKPQISAVGESVYSTVPVIRGSWKFMQGTSMACPYVAGSIALYLQQHGVENSLPNVVHEKFQNYAFQPNVDNTTSGKLDSPLRVGAGAIQVYDTIIQTTHVTPAQISFNDTSSTNYQTQNLTIINNGLEDITYRIFNNVSIAISPYNRKKSGYSTLPLPSNVEVAANIDLSATKISLKPGHNRTITVTVHPPNTNPLDHIIYGGFIQFSPINNIKAKPLHVPYFGIVGRQYDLPIFEPNNDDFGKITVNATSYNLTYTVLWSPKISRNITISFKISTPTLFLKGEVLSESHNVLGDFMSTIKYNSKTLDGLKKLYWYGNYFKYISPVESFTQFPNKTTSAPHKATKGTYYIRIKGLKIFGDVKNTNDWDYFTVGPFIIEC